MSRLLKQSSTAQALEFFLAQSSDHITGLTGASATVTIRKANASAAGSFGTPAGTVRELANGWYQVDGNATDTATLGSLLLHATATSADPADVQFEVVAFDPQIGTNLGLSALPTANPGAANGVTIAGSNAATTFSGLTTGALSCTTITASGAVAFQSTFAVTTSTSLAALSASTVTFSGAVAFQSTFATTGTTTFNAFTVTNNMLVSGTITLSGAVSLGSTLGVTGAATFTAGIVGNITGNLSGSVGSVTGLTASNLDTTVSSRMATYTQPTGFLAATFPATVASTTNITAATGITVSTNSDKTGYSLTQTFPTNFSSLVISGAGYAGADVQLINGTHNYAIYLASMVVDYQGGVLAVGTTGTVGATGLAAIDAQLSGTHGSGSWGSSGGGGGGDATEATSQKILKVVQAQET